MPIVHAVDGVLTLYQERQGSQRYKAPRRSRPALEEPAEEGHTSESDFAYLAAQQAYGHNTPPRPRKPAVLAFTLQERKNNEWHPRRDLHPVPRLEGPES